MAEPKYGAFESNPARFTDNEAWVYQHDNVWRLDERSRALGSMLLS